MDGYCVKCKEKGATMEGVAIHKTARGGYMAKGKHGKCGTTICKIMSESAAKDAMASGVPAA